MVQAVLLAGPERRRRWSADERAEILTAAFAPGANVSEVARRYDVSTGLIYTWRRQALATEVGPAIVPAKVVDKLSKPLIDDMEIWIRDQRAKLSRFHDLAKAFDYMLNRWESFTRAVHVLTEAYPALRK
jgi:transposase